MTLIENIRIPGYTIAFAEGRLHVLHNNELVLLGTHMNTAKPAIAAIYEIDELAQKLRLPRNPPAQDHDAISGSPLTEAIEGGKYTLIIDKSDRIAMLRHGQPWNSFDHFAGFEYDLWLNLGHYLADLRAAAKQG